MAAVTIISATTATHGATVKPTQYIVSGFMVSTPISMLAHIPQTTKNIRPILPLLYHLNLRYVLLISSTMTVPMTINPTVAHPLPTNNLMPPPPHNPPPPATSAHSQKSHSNLR